jgi:flagellar biogenesis protein FliO
MTSVSVLMLLLMLLMLLLLLVVKRLPTNTHKSAQKSQIVSTTWA